MVQQAPAYNPPPAPIPAKGAKQNTHVPVVVDDGNSRFATCVATLQVIFLALFAIGTEYSKNVAHVSDLEHGGMDFYYGMFQDVHVMIFIGFGFLMTFLSRYSFSALGFTLFIGALVIQFSLLTNGFWHMVHSGHWEKIHIDITHLIRADFVAGSVLITFGGLLGKVSPLQLLVIALIECVAQGANEMIGNLELGAVDMGGSIFVHTFGAYFGLACCWAMRHHHNPKQDANGVSAALSEHPKCGSTKTSDTFAMIGTIFLWLFWPSFNGALAAGAQQHRVVVNTVLALSSCCMAAFAASAMLRKGHKFDMVDIQNATLAGGVAVGSSSDLVIQPWGALLIGLLAGWLSVVGYVYISPWLERKIGLHDTCGIHNLHGMPGILGAVGGAISASLAGDSHIVGDNVNSIFPKRAPSTHAAALAQGWTGPLGDNRSAAEQGGYQIAALAVALAIAIVGGIIAGKIASLNVFQPLTETWQLFEDEMYWECPEDEEGSEVHRISEGKDNKIRLAELKSQLAQVTAALAQFERGDPKGMA